jgi:hypothetical protein
MSKTKAAGCVAEKLADVTVKKKEPFTNIYTVVEVSCHNGQYVVQCEEGFTTAIKKRGHLVWQNMELNYR